MQEILFASNNRGKWLELVDDFKRVGIKLLFAKEDLGYSLNLEEDELTLVSNSLSKARSAAKQTGIMALGDDSGIFIDALDYFPGVYSRRWYGAENDDRVRNEKLLEIMKDKTNRKTFLISRFVLVNKDGKELFSTVVKNEFNLSYEIRGNNGFGYDPILESPLNQKTMGEMNQEEKNRIANRGRIAFEIMDFLSW